MYAYCGNEPIANYDPAGNYYAKVEDRITTGCGGRGGIPAATVKPNLDQQPKRDKVGLIDFITNTDEQVVLEAKRFAFYKGVPVVKLPIGTDAFSFGIMVLGDGVANRYNAIETVQHEYGHAVHYHLAGVGSYAINAFAPSLAGYWLGDDNYDTNYYSYVYEYTADVLGGVNRSNYPYATATEDWWGAYLFYTILYP